MNTFFITKEIINPSEWIDHETGYRDVPNEVRVAQLTTNKPMSEVIELVRGTSPYRLLGSTIDMVWVSDQIPDVDNLSDWGIITEEELVEAHNDDVV